MGHLQSLAFIAFGFGQSMGWRPVLLNFECVAKVIISYLHDPRKHIVGKLIELSKIGVSLERKLVFSSIFFWVAGWSLAFKYKCLTPL